MSRRCSRKGEAGGVAPEAARSGLGLGPALPLAWLAVAGCNFVQSVGDTPDAGTASSTTSAGGGSTSGAAGSSSGGGGCPAPSGSAPFGAACPAGPSSCASGFCIDVGTTGPVCSQLCSSGACPGGATCDLETFAALGYSVCRASGQASAAASLPCAQDSDCFCIQPGTVCGDNQGTRTCTLLCAQTSDCQPVLAGFQFKNATCQLDATTNRHECLTNPACAANPLSCVPTQVGGAGTTGGGGCGGSLGQTCSPSCPCSASYQCSSSASPVCCPGPGIQPSGIPCNLDCDCASLACLSGGSCR